MLQHGACNQWSDPSGRQRDGTECSYDSELSTQAAENNNLTCGINIIQSHSSNIHILNAAINQARVIYEWPRDKKGCYLLVLRENLSVLHEKRPRREVTLSHCSLPSARMMARRRRASPTARHVGETGSLSAFIVCFLDHVNKPPGLWSSCVSFCKMEALTLNALVQSD